MLSAKTLLPTLLFPAALLVAYVAVTARVAHAGGAAGAVPAPFFPAVAGENLEGRAYRLPGDLEGTTNLILVAFQRWQQRDVDGWMPFAARLAEENPGLAWYEVPVLGSSWRVVRGWIDGGMRSGIPSAAQRARTITLYLDKPAFRRSLGIADERSIHALLVDRSGTVLARAAGPFTPEKGAAFVRALAPAEAKAPAAVADLVDVAREAGSFGTLLAAAEAAGLVDALRSPGPFTVFAPTDEAFRRLPPGTVESLLRPENRERLRSVLTYHVVSGRVPAAQAARLDRASTLEGSALPLRVEGSTLFVGGARVVKADVSATNGLIHVIDAVLLPPSPATAPGGVLAPVQAVLREAIGRGAPLYNRGNAEACAATYETAAESVLRLAADLDPTTRATLEAAVAGARGSHDASDRAWTLRRAFDRILSR